MIPWIQLAITTLVILVVAKAAHAPAPAAHHEPLQHRGDVRLRA